MVSKYICKSYINLQPRYFSLHNNAVPYTTQVTKLLLDTLLRTKKCKCYNPYDKYIANIYKVFIYWIVLMKNKIDTSCHNKLITFIIEQIKPEKSCLQLMVKLLIF